MTYVPTYEYSIGTTLATLTRLNALSTPVIWPRHDYQRYTETVTLGDGTERGVGAPKVTWAWDLIKQAQWTQLYSYRTGLSTPVYIRSKNDYDQWVTFYGYMIWPANMEWVVSRGLKFNLEFRMLVEIGSGLAGITLDALTVVGTGTVA